MNSLRNRFRLLGFLLIALLLTACFHNDSDDAAAPQTGTVSGTVISAMTGAPISGATVRAGAATVTTAADGSYTLSADTSERAIISISAPGFAETFQIARLATGRTASLEVQLLPVGVTRSINVAAGDTVTVPDSTAQVTIPPGGLVPATGGAAASTVNVSLTPINPAIDSSVMLGDFTALLSGGTTPVPIESFGALRVDVRDASGTRYTLAAGQTATIRIPLGTLSASPPPTIPLLIFNETTGRWVEEGTATLAGTAQNLFYTGTVTRFGAWNADVPMDTVYVSGCVRDTANQPVENVSVKADGINYSGSDSTRTAADGSFRVALRRNGLATLGVTFPRNGKPVTTTVNAGPYTTDFTLTPCIVTEPVPLAMTARTLPSGIVGTPYNARLAATNGTKPYAWSFSGALPTGLTLDSATGQISGTPTTAATFSGSFEVRDSSAPAQTASAPFSIIVVAPAPLTMITPALPSGTVGVPYSATLAAINGTQPYAWSVTAGALPAGLTLGATGQVSGTPAAAGTSSGTFQVQDSAASPQSASAPFSITIAAPDVTAPTVANTTPANGATNVAAGTAISAVFSEAMNPATLSAATFGVAGVSGSVTAAGNSAVFTPSSPLAYSTLYTATLRGGAGGVADAAGNTLGSDYSWTFTTQPPPAPAIPAAPSGVVTAPGNGQVTISWNPSAGATAYNLYMASVSGVTKLNYSSLAGGMKHTGVTSPYLHTGLTNGTTYYFVVTALNATGESVESAQVLATPGVGGGGVSASARIAAGGVHSCHVLASGAVRCWGYNGYGQLGNGGAGSATPVTVSGITTATAVAAGTLHSCALLSSGVVQCWGHNGWGRLGNGGTTNSATPVTVSGITTATAVATGRHHSCALLSSGAVQCWGDNNNGALGNGSTTDSTTPVTVSGLP